MRINKVTEAKVQRDYFFVEGNLDINCKYFIKEIEKGLSQDDNANYMTNIRGNMTSPIYFMKDKEFIKILQPLLDCIDENIKNAPSYVLESAWGYREGFGEYTREHDHAGCWVSGVIYLNKHHQKLMLNYSLSMISSMKVNLQKTQHLLPLKDSNAFQELFRHFH